MSEKIFRPPRPRPRPPPPPPPARPPRRAPSLEFSRSSGEEYIHLQKRLAYQEVKFEEPNELDLEIEQNTLFVRPPREWIDNDREHVRNLTGNAPSRSDYDQGVLNFRELKDASRLIAEGYPTRFDTMLSGFMTDLPEDLDLDAYLSQGPSMNTVEDLKNEVQRAREFIQNLPPDQRQELFSAFAKVARMPSGQGRALY